MTDNAKIILGGLILGSLILFAQSLLDDNRVEASRDICRNKGMPYSIVLDRAIICIDKDNHLIYGGH